MPETASRSRNAHESSTIAGSVLSAKDNVLALTMSDASSTPGDFLILGDADTASSNSVGSTALVDTPARQNEVLGQHLPFQHQKAAVIRAPDRRPTTAQWTRRYLVLLLAIDALAATLASLTAFFARVPEGPARTIWTWHYAPATLALPVLWIGVLGCVDAYDRRVFGLGAQEYQRVLRGFVLMLALVCVSAYGARIEVARGYVVIALPLAAGLTLIARYAARKQLHRQRITGQLGTSVLAVGDGSSVAELAAHLHSQPYLGLQVVAASVLPHELSDPRVLAQLNGAGIAVLGDVDSVADALRVSGAEAVAVTSRAVSPRQLRELSWELERTQTELMVVPGMVEIAGPRLHIRPITGLPMLQIERPEFTGARRVVKSIFDRTASGLGLLLLSPLLLTVLIAVRVTSPGPAFFRQTRVGRNGEQFRIWKFRSMYIDAEARRAEYDALNENVGAGMFKMRADPRITSVGRVLRRYSLDELPQLINVLRGDMSLVGPRPPLPTEVEKYAFDARRRLLVRPGLTGLWQISGRSDLSWEETVRLDLRYVENWSLSQDALILWKTVATVARGTGAY